MGSLVRAVDTRRAPGVTADSNLGYLVLGILIERVSGLGFEAYVSRNVLRPLGATASGFDMPPDAARGYGRAWSIMGIAARLLTDRKVLGATRGGFTALRPFQVDGAPYGGLVGPVTDMLSLGRTMLQGGRGADSAQLEPGRQTQPKPRAMVPSIAAARAMYSARAQTLAEAMESFNWLNFASS